MNNQIYIDTVRDQIKAGVYDHLLPPHAFSALLPQLSTMVFLDIGANTGQVANYFKPYSKRIVALEPAPDTFQILTDNIGKTVECYQVALAPKDGPVDFYVNDINFTASSTVNTYGNKITVEGKTLHSMLRDYKLDHVDVCKCDAEGAEGEALDFNELWNARFVIDKWYVETHNCPKTTWEHKLGTLVGNFARCGYTKMKIDGMAITATK